MKLGREKPLPVKRQATISYNEEKTAEWHKIYNLNIEGIEKVTENESNNAIPRILSVDNVLIRWT